MPQYVQIANIILSSFTIVAQIFSVILLVRLLKKWGQAQRMGSETTGSGTRLRQGFGAAVAKTEPDPKLNQIPILRCAFIIALIAMLGSLFYSEIAGYEPCKLCWYQRILMYPQIILLGSALIFKWKDMLKACGALSGLGAFIAGYHYLLQLGVVKGECGVVGYSVSCSQRFVMNFGYITIPLMAFSAFLLILLLALTAHRFQRSHERSLEKNNS